MSPKAVARRGFAYRVLERFRAHTVSNASWIRPHAPSRFTWAREAPDLGDPLYCARQLPKAATPELAEALRGFGRQALHAEHLTFRHPVDGHDVATHAPLPADLQALVATLREDTRAQATR